MCCHRGNPIFFNKKNKDWTSRTLTNLHTPTSDNISFLPYPPPPPPPQSGRHMCTTLKVLTINDIFNVLRTVYCINVLCRSNLLIHFKWGMLDS